eukprot:CAMPEP_0182844114 /NCGR_PEP_ID=MMETSP0006_2-20121128/26577_1 /TAXON_ID=97485 /ORGANISM="Prymnesium parvum, Strain Texoma1" /LENGTH=130 /DNA_ID=CAMNT_0024974009 /DNA_START=459 /DNA_END=848 /DNA_ORIENTATION=+
MTTVKSSGASVKSWQYDIVRTVAIDGVPPPARKDCSPNAIPSVILATSTPSSDRSNSPAWMRFNHRFDRPTPPALQQVGRADGPRVEEYRGVVAALLNQVLEWLGFFLNLSMLQALGIRAHDASAKLAER